MLGKIKSKYITKKIFSCLKVPTILKFIKTNKNIRDNLEITIFHYQYYYIFNLFKHIKINTIFDILNSAYIQILPENTKYEIIWKLVERRGLFKNQPIPLGKGYYCMPTSYISQNKKKINNFFICNEQYFSDFSYFLKNNINKIIHEISLNSFNTEIINKYNFQNLKYLSINDPDNKDNKDIITIINISNLNNLEYLSIMLSKRIKILFSKYQLKNLKTLKLYEKHKSYSTYFQNIKDIYYECYENNNEAKEEFLFENLNELHINLCLLNKIHFNSSSLKKLYLLYDIRNRSCDIESIQNKILTNYYLTNLNIDFILEDFTDLSKKNITIKNILNHKWLSIIENISFYCENNNYFPNNYYEILKISKIPNKTKFAIVGQKFQTEYIESIESFFHNTEEIDLSFDNNDFGCSIPNLNIEENNSISSITRIRINTNSKNIIYILTKSYNSLNVLVLNISYYDFQTTFPLFCKDSMIKFPNLQHLEFYSYKNNISIFYILIDNLCNVPNLQFLLIYNYLFESTYPIRNIIISKCCLLKKLHTLNLNKNGILKNVNQYFSEYPELINTNIKFIAI